MSVDPELLQRCRRGLMEHAKDARGYGASAAEWEELALESEAGRTVGRREVEAVAFLAFGLSRSGWR